jgi:hypothetical protein
MRVRSADTVKILDGLLKIIQIQYTKQNVYLI